MYLVRYGDRALRHSQLLALGVNDGNPVISLKQKRGEKATEMEKEKEKAEEKEKEEEKKESENN